jgi:predicted DNA-binding transcriptional regulator YafY
MPYVSRHEGGVLVSELAEMLGIRPREMAQEVRDLLQAGLPNGSPAEYFDICIEGRGPSARVVATPSRLLRRPPRLTPHEAYALLLGAAALRSIGLPVFDDALARAATKIRGLLTLPGSGTAQPLPVGLLLESGRPNRPDVFGVLARASRERRVVELDYVSLAGQQRKKIIVEPYGLLNHQGGWYVLGKSRSHAEERVFVFKVERIIAASPREERFVLPADFDLRNYRGERLFIAGLATVEVKLRLRGAAARRLGPLFKHARLERGGGLIVRFRDCPTGWLATWILRQGSQVQVLSPPRLAAWVGDLARRVAEGHESVSDLDATSVADEPIR